MAKTRYTPLRVYINGGTVRVARDRFINGGPIPHPEHLRERPTGRLQWYPHREGGAMVSLPLSAFIAWLAQGGTQKDYPEVDES